MECFTHFEEEQRRNWPLFRFPSGRANFGELLCCSSFEYIKYTSLLASRISLKIRSVKVMEFVRQRADLGTLDDDLGFSPRDHGA